MLSAWKLKLGLLDPSETLEVKLQVPGVVSKPLPLMVPIPVTLRKFASCWTMADEFRLKVKPPTLQSAVVEVEGLKIHGVAMEAKSPGSIE